MALAIAFDDASLTPYQLQYIRTLAVALGPAGVILGAVLGYVRYLKERREESRRYLDERREELAWQKTLFMVELFEDFDHDVELRRALNLIDDARATGNRARLARVVGTRRGLTAAQLADRRALDRYLDFFDHLYTYVFVTGTLSADDVASFSGYVIEIFDAPELSDFANELGYEDVLRLGEHFIRRAAKERRAEEAEELMMRVKEEQARRRNVRRSKIKKTQAGEE